MRERYRTVLDEASRALVFFLVAGCGDAGESAPARPTVPPGAVAVTVDGGQVASEVDDRFLSFSVDTAQLVGGTFWSADGGVEVGRGEELVPPYDFDRPKLRGLAAALTPAYLRIGGSDADFTFYDFGDDPVDTPPEGYDWVMTRDMFDGMSRFATDLGLGVIFTVNGGSGPRDAAGVWQADQARSLVGYAADHGSPVGVWELSNEPNVFGLLMGEEMSGQRLAQDYRAFRDAVRQLQPSARISGPTVALWPLTGEILTPILDDFLREAGDVVDIIPWHYYPLQSQRCPIATREAVSGVLLSGEQLDETANMAEVVESARLDLAPQAEVWLGEGGHAQHGGEPGLSESFEATLWWLDQLGLLARRGHRVMVRQTLSGSNYGLIDDVTLEPNPDYYASVLWKRFMGSRVLDVRTDESAPDVRVYAHCLPAAAAAVPDTAALADGAGAGLVALNLTGETVELAVDGFSADRVRMLRGTATSLDSRTVLVEGEAATAAEDGSWQPPAASEQLATADGRVLVQLAPHSYAFVATDVALPACE